jgi:hypothetical protein
VCFSLGRLTTRHNPVTSRKLGTALKLVLLVRAVVDAKSWGAECAWPVDENWREKRVRLRVPLYIYECFFRASCSPYFSVARKLFLGRWFLVS